MHPESRRRLAALADRWNDVERRLKEIEQLRGEAILAAVNELRYTGRKVADILLLVTQEDQSESVLTKIHEQIIVAENYLINGDHDLTDSAVLFVSLRVQRVIEAHGFPKVIRVAPKFEELSAVLDEAKRIVVDSRGDRSRRSEFYGRLAKESIPRLIELNALLRSDPELSLPDGGVKKGLQLVTILAIIGVFAGVGTFIFHLLGWFHPGPDIEQIKSVIEHALKPR